MHVLKVISFINSAFFLDVMSCSVVELQYLREHDTCEDNRITWKVGALYQIARLRTFIVHSFIQYSVWRQVQSLLQNDASI